MFSWQDVIIACRLLCGKWRSDDDDLKANAVQANLQVFHGFLEQGHRRVYEPKDASIETEEVFTILPSGGVLNKKAVQPGKGRGLMTFG